MNRKHIFVIIAVVLFAGFGAGLWYFFELQRERQIQPPQVVDPQQRALLQLEESSFSLVKSSDLSGVSTIALTKLATDVPAIFLPRAPLRQFLTSDIKLCANMMKLNGLDSAICIPQNDDIAVLSATDSLQSGAFVTTIASSRAPDVPFSKYYLCGYSDLPLISSFSIPWMIQTGSLSPLAIKIGTDTATVHYSAWTCLSAPVSSAMLTEAVRFIRVGNVLPQPGHYTLASIYAFNSNGFNPSIFFDRIQKEGTIDVINSYENVNIIRIEGAVQ